MKPPNQSGTGRLLHFLTGVVFAHPRWFCLVQLGLVLACIGYAMNSLRISTDKTDLISRQASYWSQFQEFKRDFNIHDDLFVIVESGSREKNREFVERLAARLRADDQFSAIYYRAGLKLMGPKALLFLPEDTLTELRTNLRTFQPWFQSYSRATSLDMLFARINRQFRQQGTRMSQEEQESTLPRSLQTLQWILDKASDCIESPETPLAPDVATLLGIGRDETRPEQYLTFERGRIFALIAKAKDPREEWVAIRQLRKSIARTRSEVPGVNVEITGEPVLRHDEMVQARYDTEIASLVALALTALIFIRSCRDILRPLMATVCLLVGIGYALGFATLAVGRLNILSITLVPILIGLAIDYGVHLIFRYEEELAHGRSRRFAIGKALEYSGVGVVANALTIAGGFYSMVLTDFKGMQEMGVIAGTGVILCLVPMLTLLPLFLARGKSALPDEREKGSNPGRRSPLANSLKCPGDDRRAALRKQRRRARIQELFLKRPWWVLGCGAILTLFMVLGAFRVQFDYNLLNLQSRGLPAVRLQKQLIRSDSESLLYCAVIADSLPQAVEWEQRISQLPSVSRVLSLVKTLTEDQERKLGLIHEISQEVSAIRLSPFELQPVNLTNLNQTLFSLSGYLGRAVSTLRSRGNDAGSEELLSSVRSSLARLRRLTVDNPPAAAARLTFFQQSLFGSLHETVSLVKQQDYRQRLQVQDVPAFLRDFFISRSGKFLLQVYPKKDVWQRDRQEEFIRELRTVDPEVTGSPVQFYEYTTQLKREVQKAAIGAAAIIAILVFLHFHRLSSLLLALFPVALGICWMLGLMGWLGIPFNPVNIVGLTLVIGIGVTNGVHILNRFAEEPQPNILARSTGKAVLVSALNTIAGFGSLMVAEHQGIASFGGIMAIGTATCVVASLAFLPAVLTLLCRIGWRPT